jgi:hypothetical protein
MNDASWWAAWGQSATAIGGFVLGADGLGLGIYSTIMAREKHAWEKQDRGSGARTRAVSTRRRRR